VLLPRLAEPDERIAVRMGDAALSYAELSRAAAGVAEAIAGRERVAVWAEPSLVTCAAVAGALAAGAAVVPLNPGYGERELGHIAADATPELILTGEGAELPPPLDRIGRLDVDLHPVGDARLRDTMRPDDAAFVIYTSGTTGPPKGAVLPLRAVSANLDALAEVWGWTERDRLAHALPLFHVHGLILGILGPLRRGGEVEHVGRFSPGALAGALERGATMVFGVPTMYGRIVAEAEVNPEIADAFRKARLLVSGSAALPGVVSRRLRELTGRLVVERYGLTETLILTAARPGDPEQAGTVGPPLPGVELELQGEDGEVVARGPSVFTGYLNRPDATAEALRDGWFHTGDLATHAPGGAIRIVGRRETDLIKSGGYKIGAGEIEEALLEHPAVAEVAVAGREDDDLGERVVAWVVLAPGQDAGEDELRAHVGRLLAAYKRPRQVHFVDALPRNALGKVTKRDLTP
jgi:malonyl-CoA/methylmalonyl-CoA synthetase